VKITSRTMKKTGLSTRTTDRGSNQDTDEGHPQRAASESGDPDDRPLTAAVLRDTLQQLTDGMLRQQMEMQRQQQQFLQQFLERMTEQRLVQHEPLILNLEPHDDDGARPPANGANGEDFVSAPRSRLSANSNHAQSDVKVSWLATQIPEFGGTQGESVVQWIRRVDKVAQVHGASDGVVLLAASSRLTKSAKKWYEFQTSAVIESWPSLKSELQKIFERKLPFFRLMQQAEARKWSPFKETFDQYAIDKLALLHQLNLPETDTVHLLIGGISQSSFRATALSVANEPLDSFLDKMRCITEGVSDLDRKPALHQNTTKTKETTCRNCGKKGHDLQACKEPPTCFYCKQKGHTKFQCTKPGARALTQGRPQEAQVAAPVTEDEPITSSSEETSSELVALIREGDGDLRRADSKVKVVSICNNKCELFALFDIDSPVSFIKYDLYLNLIRSRVGNLDYTNRKFVNIKGDPFNLAGVVTIDIELENFNDSFRVELYVLRESMISYDMILGRDFIGKEKFLITCDKINAPPDQIQSNAMLFEALPLYVENDCTQLSETLDNVLAECNATVRVHLVNLIKEIEETRFDTIEDDYVVKVRLKDESIFAFAPRRFAHLERLQLRQITDDLLERRIIKNSISPYCSRVVLVKKKNGLPRLCIDLRPLNARIAKQKYPFLVIEDCLACLINKSIFTLLDLKDGFHQIKVHDQSTKYFSFAIPDGQFEYTRLPFGYSEAPAEFQKRIIQILNPLIRQDKIIVYIDDILIPLKSVDENIQTLKETLILLKRYGFEINYKKCLFLKTKIEFLGYVISHNEASLSPRHTEAINKFKQPTNVHEVQRFLGLLSYFRKFIKDFSLKARPLHNLLRKNAPFDFDRSCVESFELLKRELITHPVLALYDPTAETELHTDACSQGLGGVLLQKQKTGTWSVIAYFSRSTNSAETRYHSYELEMLAIVRAVERFHLYLYGLNFTIVSDCNALVYAVNKANLNPRIARWTLALQNYSFKIVHRPGTKMRHVDALSRAVAHVSEMPLERELEFRQIADPKLKQISEDLEFKDSEKFSLVNGLVYRKQDVNLKFAVPESMVVSVLRAHHDDSGHVGKEKTYQSISQNYWFPAMRKRVYDYVDNCFKCIMSNDSPNRFEKELHLYPSSTVPMHSIHIDHFDPLQETEQRFRHILVVVDAFTRFTWLRAVKSTTSKESIEHLRNIFSEYGNPSTIVSDRGTVFTSKEFEAFISETLINHRLVAVAAPWANGLVERVNRFLKNLLTKLSSSLTEWKGKLHEAQYII